MMQENIPGQEAVQAGAHQIVLTGHAVVLLGAVFTAAAAIIQEDAILMLTVITGHGMIQIL